MKKSFIIILWLALFTVLLVSCGESGAAETPLPSETQTQTESPPPPEPPPPDFSGTDFTGEWSVLKVTASDGSEASEEEKKSLGADFTLELLKDGVCFVYNGEGKVLGQGNYSVELNKLTITAADKQTVYEIVDENTLKSASEVGSITFMARLPDEPEGTDGEPADAGEPEETDADTGDADADSGESDAPAQT